MDQISENKLQPNSQVSSFGNFLSIYYRSSLFISSLCMITGVILFSLEDNNTFDFSNVNTTIIFQEIFKLSSEGLMFLGIIILLLIPFGQVLIFVVHYFSKKDYLFIGVSLTVLVFMLIGIIFDIK